MSCVFCTEYKGLKRLCRKWIFVENLSESFDCEHYNYNQEVKANE